MKWDERLRDWLFGVSRRFGRFATPARVALDVAVWCMATAAAVYLRFGSSLDQVTTSGWLRAVPMVACLQVLAGTATGLYRRRWLYGSFDEVKALIVTSILTSGLLYLLNEYYFDTRPIPQSVVVVGGVFGLVLMGGCRYVWRLLLEKARRPDARSSEKLLVYGAGEGGLQVITSLMRSRSSPFVPVGILDDDPAKQRLSMMGVPVLGGRSALPAAKAKTGATSLLIAVPSRRESLVNLQISPWPTISASRSCPRSMSCSIIRSAKQTFGISPKKTCSAGISSRRISMRLLDTSPENV
jgi:FlaA1/EpsC-like NDP-sugar epimerase